VTPSAKRQAVGILTGEHQLSVRRACGAVRLARAAYYRPLQERLTRDQPVIDALQSVVAENTRWGFWKCFDRLRNQGRRWNHKRVHRVYCALRLNLPRRTRRRVPRRPRHPLDAPPALNRTWAIDFMTDTLYDGRRFRTLNVIDEGNREGLALDVGMSLPSGRVIAVLDELVAMHGTPRALRVDNGPELTSIALTRWCARLGIALHYIQPGKPQQNAYIERFNRSYRTEILNAYVFQSLAEVRSLTAEWLIKYNTQRPHDSLGRVPPLTFLPRPTAPSKSTYAWSA
jgi:putative transposase